HRLNLGWKLSDDLELKSISAYRKLDQTQYDNGAQVLSVFSPNTVFSRYSIAKVKQDQYSQEVQLIGKTSRLDYVVGAFYYREAVDDSAQTPNTLKWNATGTAYTTLPLDLNAVPYDRVSDVTTTSYGVFGQAAWT